MDHARFDPGPDRRWRVLAVASAAWHVPVADAVFDLDSDWIARHASSLDLLAESETEVYLLWRKGDDARRRLGIKGVTWLVGSRGDATLSDDPDRLEVGNTSGFAALNLAWLKRQTGPMVLFGYDYRVDGAQHHARNEDYPSQKVGIDEYWPTWAQMFSATMPQWRSRGVSILNASPTSSIVAFARCEIEAGFRALQASAMEAA